MKAFGNHFRVDDDASARMLTYDSRIASVFEVSIGDATDVFVNYIGFVKDIFKFDYRPLLRPIVLLRCKWAKWADSRGNTTYIHDNAGFLLVNDRHSLPRMLNSFLFVVQAIQVFYSEDPYKPR